MERLHVVIDGRPLVGHRTGIGVHTAEIARRLPFDPPPLFASHATIENRDGIERCRFAVDPYPFGVVWQQIALPRIEAEVVWGPHGTLPLALKRPAVVTLHDFTSITMPWRHELKTIVSFDLFIARSLELAHRVAAVSKRVADEAIRGFAVPPSKIEIVPNGVDEFFSPGESDEEGDYILYAGTLEPRKGIGDLIAAWRSLPDPRPRLVLCGDPGWGTRFEIRDSRLEIRASRISNPESRITPEDRGLELAGFVPKQRLRELYRGARLFVYPSEYEGFGIPPLEAMACGAPVVATRTGAIPEYAEGAAILVGPRDRQALADAMAKVLGDRELRDELRRRGPERASHYRWDGSAHTMAALLKEAARCG